MTSFPKISSNLKIFRLNKTSNNFVVAKFTKLCLFFFHHFVCVKYLLLSFYNYFFELKDFLSKNKKNVAQMLKSEQVVEVSAKMFVSST